VKKKILSSFILLFAVLFGNGQKLEEYKIHLRSIDSTFYPGERKSDSSKPNINESRAFVFYTIKNLLEKPSDIQFISNRKLLPKLKNNYCNSRITSISGILKTGEKCSIKIKKQVFNPKQHRIIYDSINEYHIIDGDTGWGGLPEYEIKTLSVKINNKELFIPKFAYETLYDLNICHNDGFHKKIEAFTSIDGQFIYIYIYGGFASGNYFAKLIFDKEKYLTKIVADYYALSIHSAFRYGFVGY